MNPSASGANLPALRSHNAALVLGLLRSATVYASGGAPGAEGGISRLELAERTGLTPQAVSKITARLRAEGLVEEAGRRASTGGKPRTELRLVAGARHAVGLHLDGERLTAVLTDLTGRTVACREAPLDLGLPVGPALDAIVHEVRAAIAAAPGPVLGVGVGMRGPLDHRTGTLHRVTGFPHWQHHPLRATLAIRLGLPVALDKNTNAAALSVLAEAPPAGDGDAAGALRLGGGDAAGAVGDGAPLSGSAARRASFAYVHLGAGLGAGLVLGGEVYRGGRTGAGEFGHQVVELGGELCKCGNRGCLEALCLAAVGRGDIAGAARLLGVGAANLVALLDIDRVVLGGRAVHAAPDVFATQVAAVLAEYGRSVPVGFAAAGPRAVAEGAALLVLAPLFGGALGTAAIA
ncbi:Sugar kinase of the NBD/HSP70 family, may contain an N-terminal HTH domain [Actinacidiphila alni]|uniref:Sugar kinase of the NBD/HSP70 family, may contain an N-terminal HTH domain n=1 Tax=Actinacidiphila alni TaxID=380248 RepID=A0A1I2KGP1_9ACTN|nr:ROK family transcriptional regulator [Actinacidiphila alni]SFF64096.1 Sugar kinase of the NBD/HSP70 family, may contain an N-terminal HTH domain [Actinacidiphila alni]